jgi:Glycine rich protein
MTGCAGSAGTLPVPATGVPANARAPISAAAFADAGRADGRVKVRISVPAAQPALRARFVAPSTRGLMVDFKRGRKSSKHAFALTAGTHGCAAKKTAVVCSFTVSLPAGKYRANVATYDAPPVGNRMPASAHELASDPSIPVTVSTGKAAALKFVLDGIPAMVFLDPPNANAGIAFPEPQPIGLNVADADGNTILGKYAGTIAMADSDTSGTTTLATQGADAPPPFTLKSSSDFATLAYTGLAIQPVAITATIQSSGHIASGSFAPVLDPIVVTTTDTQNPNFAGVDLRQYGGGHGSSGTMTLSEYGWSNAPYNKTFSVVPASGCSSIASTTPSSGTVFTATSANPPTPGQCTITFSDGAGQQKTATLAYTGYYAPGSPQSLVVPAGVTSITFVLFGAAGAPVAPMPGGGGAYMIATLPATAGQTFYLYVGAGGSIGSSGGWNGGGAGTSTSSSGGDASDVRTGGTDLSDRVLVAGGGGGAGICGTAVAGAGGGGPTGANASAPLGGGGGSQSVGGVPGNFGGIAGGLGFGGAGGGCGGGGGGGGYYGGGGGGGNAIGPAAGGGGGGSSFVSSLATGVTNQQGTTSLGEGGGGVILEW